MKNKVLPFLSILLFLNGCSILESSNTTTLDGYYAQVSVQNSCVGHGRIRNIAQNLQYIEVQEKYEPSIFNSDAVTYTKNILILNGATNEVPKIRKNE